MLRYNGKVVKPTKSPTRRQAVRLGPPPAVDSTDVQTVRAVFGPQTPKPRATGGGRPRVQLGPPPAVATPAEPTPAEPTPAEPTTGQTEQ